MWPFILVNIALIDHQISITMKQTLKFRDLDSISSTFYIQLFCLKIPKVYKDTDDLTVFFMLLRSTSIKAARKMLVKLTPGLNFINVRHTAFALVEIPKA